MEKVAHFERKQPQPLIHRLAFLVNDDHIMTVRVRGYSVGNRVIEATVQSAEFLHVDRRLLFGCEFRDRLAEIAVVVDDLADGKSLFEQVTAVFTRRNANLGG